MKYAIETQELTRRYRRHLAVDRLDLRIPTGCAYALLGPNGAGKSTTLRMILDLIHPSSGSATVLGHPSTRLRGKPFEEIGYVAEQQQLPSWMQVEDFLQWCRPLYPTWDQDLCNELIQRFQLPSDKKIRELSRGMEMKLRLVASLAFRPRLLVLDEPFAGLDVVARDEFLEGVLELAASAQWTIVIATHELDETELLADRVGFLYRGRLILDEDLDGLRERFRRIEVVLPDCGCPPESQPHRGTPTREALPESQAESQTLESQAPETQASSAWPAHWLLAETSQRVIRFVDSAFDHNLEQIRQRFPEALDIAAEPLSLRSIFSTLTLAKATPQGLGKEENATPATSQGIPSRRA